MVNHNLYNETSNLHAKQWMKLTEMDDSSHFLYFSFFVCGACEQRRTAEKSFVFSNLNECFSGVFWISILAMLLLKALQCFSFQFRLNFSFLWQKIFENMIMSEIIYIRLQKYSSLSVSVTAFHLFWISSTTLLPWLVTKINGLILPDK